VDAGDYAVGARAPGGIFVADDFIAMPLATGTHIDALAHVWSTNGLYNGHDPNSVRSRGAKRCGIDKVAGIVTSALLVDLPRLHGIDALLPSHVISAAELEVATDACGRPVGAGDAVLIRTGWLTEENLAARGLEVIETQEPGIGIEAAAWLAARDISLVGADTLGVEVLPAEGDHPGAPVHVTLLNRFGIHIVELLALDELAALAPARFLLVIAPLPISGAVNSPINPLAIL
jgi:kynurenine formamidase